jgi:hypothetical protein
MQPVDVVAPLERALALLEAVGEHRNHWSRVVHREVRAFLKAGKGPAQFVSVSP